LNSSYYIASEITSDPIVSSDIQDVQNETERVERLQDAVRDLPEANRDTLAYLLLHMQRISETPECKMPASNLARVFGPSIVGNSSANLPPAEIINEIRVQHQIVENLIRVPTNFYMSFIEAGDNLQTRLFKSSGLSTNLTSGAAAATALANGKTPEQMRKSKTAVVLSSILGPAANIPVKY
jgi:Rac GTPase-activating protein 1